MERQAILTGAAPRPVGPYSQGVLAGDTLYVSGQIPLDPATGRPVEGDVQTQAARALENLRAVVEAAGMSLRDVVRTTLYLVDLADFASVNEVYGQFFGATFPARSTIQVSALPAGARLEIDAVAVRG